MAQKDTRLYGKFTLDFPRHPKIAILSDAAFRCLVEATLYSRDQLTDGLLARRYAIATWGLDVLQELCSNDDEKPSLIEVEKGWLIHDYDEHQDTKEEIEARSARNKAAGQKGGLAKAKRRAKQPASDSLSESLPETETETETKEQQKTDLLTPAGASETALSLIEPEPVEAEPVRSASYPQAFEDWWQHYPRKAGKRKAFAAWVRARRRASDEQLIAGARRYAADPNREDQFTKYPEGWLNRDGWLDAPLPDRNPARLPDRPRQDAKVAGFAAFGETPSAPRKELA